MWLRLNCPPSHPLPHTGSASYRNSELSYELASCTCDRVGSCNGGGGGDSGGGVGDSGDSGGGGGGGSGDGGGDGDNGGDDGGARALVRPLLQIHAVSQ